MEIIPVKRIPYRREAVSEPVSTEAAGKSASVSGKDLERLLSGSEWIPFYAKSCKKNAWYLPHMEYVVEQAESYPDAFQNPKRSTSFGDTAAFLSLKEAQTVASGSVPEKFSQALRNSGTHNGNHLISFIGGSFCWETREKLTWSSASNIVIPFVNMNLYDFRAKVDSGEYLITSEAVASASDDARLEELFQSLMKSQTWIPVESTDYNDEKGWYVPSAGLLVPYKNQYPNYYGGAERSSSKPFGIPLTLPATDTMRKLLSNEPCVPWQFSNAVKSSSAGYGNGSYHYITCANGYAWCFESKQHTAQLKNTLIFIPFSQMSHDEFRTAVEKGALWMNGNQYEIAEINRMLWPSEEELDSPSSHETTVPAQAIPDAISRDELSEYAKTFLECDKRRAGIDPYDSKLLEDPNRGHWELWTETDSMETDQLRVALPEGVTWYGRDPRMDVKSGLVGIDFGTKSTIVSYQDNTAQIKFHRIGTGDSLKESESSDYENPTFMEFIDYDAFFKAYNNAVGRPETSIDHLLVSHTAFDEFRDGKENEKFYSFFYDIKQWCGESSRTVRMKDQQGKDIELPAFLECTDSGFNPLELYAYYLGLFINNMRTGIYMNYILSFPVSFSEEIRKQVLNSFRKGLMKSLPAVILKDKELMERFRVEQGITEPAAYAATALKEYGFKPRGAEKVAYAVFDFGGGTSDFDFGIWRAADPNNRKERRKDYVLEDFNQASDRQLGGENLLELLAFRIFKANAAIMRKNGFTFQKPVNEVDFPGSEVLISDSKEARRNMKNLSELLRPVWEGILGPADKTAAKALSGSMGSMMKVMNAANLKEMTAAMTSTVANPDDEIEYNGWRVKKSEVLDSIVNNGLIKATLFDRNGNKKDDVSLYVTNNTNGLQLDLVSILKDRIQLGAKQFFEAFRRAWQNIPQYRMPNHCYVIFLAGNSSRSPLLLACLQEEKERVLSKDQAAADFQFYPALGTEASRQRMRERGLKMSEVNEWSPTGKTGVAYGLILGRSGGKILISESSPERAPQFKYHLGGEQDGRFAVHSMFVRDKIKLDSWSRFSVDICQNQTLYFADCGCDVFEIYYSDLPSAATDTELPLDVGGVYKLSCYIASPDENAEIWIRCLSNDTIEYCLSREKSGPTEAETAKAVKVRLEGAGR